MIVAIEGLIPSGITNDRRAVSSEKKSASPPAVPLIDTVAWLREQQEKTTGPQPGPDLIRDEDGPGVPDPPPAAAADAPSDPGPDFDSSEPIFVHPVSPSGTTPSAPHARVPASAADILVPSSIGKKPSTGRLRL